MSVEVAEIKEVLEQIALKEPYFFNRIIRLSLDNISTKDDLKLLVELINNRFEDINKRFEDMQKYMEKRFEGIEKRFEDMNRRFEDMNKRFEDMQKYMEKRFESMEKRFNFITQLIVVFNVPILASMIGLLLKLILTK